MACTGAPRWVGRAGGGRRGRPNTGPRVPGPAVCARCEAARAVAGAAGGQGPRRAVEARGSRENFYVPSDSFGGLSPERKAAMAMKNLFSAQRPRLPPPGPASIPGGLANEI